jgi:hypothetical protein
MRAAFLLLPLSLSAACLRPTEYQCTANSQCTPAGVCQTDVGYCSFSDSACESGQRFGASAGPHANQCVGEQAGVDAGIDAPMTDAPPAACPADYAPMTGGNANHVYKKAPGNLGWVQQDDYCRSTSTRAHLAVPDNAAELTALQGLATGTFWVGINDRVTEGTFVKSSGGPATFLPWAGGEPDNGGPNPGQDCVAAMATTISTEVCDGGGANRPAACECELP